MKSDDTISHKLKQLEGIFEFKKVLRVKTDNLSIAKYYRINQIPYTLFHNKDFIHMAIRKTNKSSKEDGLLEQARIVEKYFSKKTKNVLEIGAGRGANCLYLARKYPNINFVGIDLPKGQIKYAFKKDKEVKNFQPEEGDFHDLLNHENKSFDLVFVVESLCHSQNKEKVIKEVYRVLKRDGYFIVIDAFIGKDKLTTKEIVAKRLIEKGMSVANFENYKNFISLAQKNNFRLKWEKDYSFNVLENAKIFEKEAKILISIPKIISKNLLKVLPNQFTYNAISGYLMPDFLELKIARYMLLVLQK